MYKGLKEAVISLGVIAALMFVFAPSASAHEKAMGGVQMNQEKPMSSDVNRTDMSGGNAFFRPESHWYSYEFGPADGSRGYYSEQESSDNYEVPGYHEHYDKYLPRTPYTSEKRWLP